MPQINKNINKVGTGFAAFLSPPSPDVIRFTVGQPDFATPNAVVESAKAALDRGETTYTRTQGSPALCQAVCDHLKEHEIEIDADNIIVAPGCKHEIVVPDGRLVAIHRSKKCHRVLALEHGLDLTGAR